jgi:putative permease
MGLGISRTLSIVILFFALAILVVFPLVKIIPVISIESQYVQNSIPRIEQYFFNEYGMFRDFIKLKTGHQIDDTYILQFLNEAKSSAESVAMRIPNYLANLMEWIFLVPFFTFFIIRDSVSFKKTLLSFTPNVIFERFYYVTHVFNRQLGNYFFAKFVEAIIVGGIITIGLLVMKVKYAVILGFIAGLTNIVPYVGPFLGIIPAFVLAMVEYGIASSTIGGILVLYAIANVVDVFFVFPFLVSKIVNLHPMIVAISVIAGSHYLGITGMVISIPVVAAIKLIITEIYNEIYTERSR